MTYNPLEISLDYESNDVISINYRHFALWLRQDLLDPLSGAVTEIQFQWSDNAKQANFDNKLNHIAQHAIDTMALINRTLRSANCKIICCEVDKFVCAISVVAPLPQVVYQGLLNMPCPDMFAMPQMVNHDETPAAHVAARRQALPA